MMTEVTPFDVKRRMQWSICAILFCSTCVPSLGIGQEFDQTELRRMIREKDYPELTDTPQDQELALKLLTLLGGHRDRIGNVYLSPAFGDADVPVILPFSDARGIVIGDSTLGDEGMRYFREMKSLEYLALPRAVTDAGLVHLRGLPLLNLVLPPKATDDGMESVATLGQLQGIKLSALITDEGFRHLAKLKNLSAIALNDSQVTDAAFEHIGRLPKIWILDFGTAPNITPQVAKHLKQLPDLHWLTGPPGTNDRTLELLADVKSLTRLELSSYEGVTDAGLKHLTALERMHDLALGPNVTDAGMEYIGKLPHLTNLNLSKTPVTGRGLACLGPSGPYMLEISDSVSDEGLASISKFTRLSYLILNGNFTDACLPHLPKRLNQVYFNGTKVTAEGLKKLRNERPTLIIDVRDAQGDRAFDQRSIDLSRGLK